MTETSPIKEMSVEYVLTTTFIVHIVSDIEEIHLLWTYVRSCDQVPECIRESPIVHPKILDTLNPAAARSLLINDVVGHGEGYVNAVRVADGWLFGSSAGEPVE